MTLGDDVSHFDDCVEEASQENKVRTAQRPYKDMHWLINELDSLDQPESDGHPSPLSPNPFFRMLCGTSREGDGRAASRDDHHVNSYWDRTRTYGSGGLEKQARRKLGQYTSPLECAS